MIKASVNDKVFEISTSADGIVIDGNHFRWDVVTLAPNYFHIIRNHKSYTAEIVDVDDATKTCKIKINGNIYTVSLKDKFDLLLEKMGMNNNAAGKVNNIKAPMPGLIIDLKVKEGDEVKQGDVLLILEAMKMENIIKCPGQATVKGVRVKKGDSVEKGEVLIEFVV